MPNYDYSCTKCKATYELRQGFDAPNTHNCHGCGKGTAKRLLTAPRIVFKGSGWYATDSRSKTAAIADSPDSAGESKSDSKGEAEAGTKAESKSEGKKDAKVEAKPTAAAKTESTSKSRDAVATPAS